MKILVTGSGGFLGGAIASRLVATDDVRGVNRSFYPHLEALGVEQIQGDLADPQIADQAVEGCDLVYHVAAMAGVWGDYDSFYRANVTATENIINACRCHGVRRLVYTSSPSVTFDGEDQENVDESAPYPEKFYAHYPATKAIAERMVNDADGPDLSTVSLRPHLIWGPGDNHLLPRIVQQARAGKLRLVGRRANLVDTVYIDNAVDAHLAAAERLKPGAALCGKNYFITNGEPWPMDRIINGLLEAAGLQPVNRRVPASIALLAGAVMEKAHRWLSLSGEPRLTRFVALQLATHHWFNLDAARRDLGYQPNISMDRGLELLAAHLKKSSFK